MVLMILFMEDNSLSTIMLAGFPVDILTEELSLDIGTTSVYSHILKKDGTYIIKNADAKEDSYFDQLLTLGSFDDGTPERSLLNVKEAMSTDSDYSLLVKINGELRNTHFTPLAYSDWYLVSVLYFDGKHLLLAEDNELNWEIARELLSSYGFLLTRAENGKICVEKFLSSKSNEYDTILMDIRMPIMDGYQATQAIRALDRADGKTIPIIAMTADAFSEDIQKCLKIGMNNHVSKPIDMKTLLRILSNYLTN